MSESVIVAVITGAFLLTATLITVIAQGRKTRKEVSVPDTEKTIGQKMGELDEKVQRNTEHLMAMDLAVSNLNVNVSAISGAFLQQLGREHETTMEVDRRTEAGEKLDDVLKDIVKRRLQERGIE